MKKAKFNIPDKINFLGYELSKSDEYQNPCHIKYECVPRKGWELVVWIFKERRWNTEISASFDNTPFYLAFSKGQGQLQESN